MRHGVARQRHRDVVDLVRRTHEDEGRDDGVHDGVVGHEDENAVCVGRQPHVVLRHGQLKEERTRMCDCRERN